MKLYEIMRTDGSTQEFEAKNLKDARVQASKLMSDPQEKYYIYEGYTMRARVN